MQKIYFSLIIISLCYSAVQAGNPDRQGEAGAYELLMDPWARTAGLHSMSTSLVRGVESMNLNVAGMARINKLDFGFGSTQYLQGTGINLSSAAVSAKIGKKSVMGLSLMAVDFGDIEVTTTNQPEGTGGTYSPSFFNLGFAFAHEFENKVSVGVLFRAISESLANVSAFGFAIDAGIQYVTGEEDNFKFGISLRNVGSPMTYKGEALSIQRPSPNGQPYDITVDQRGARFELPSLLNIGASYDLLFLEKHRFTVLGNFTSNSFSRDNLGAGAEYAFDERFMLRAGYKSDLNVADPIQAPIYTGLSAGGSVTFPLSKVEKNTKISVDYAYRASKVWSGTHNVSVRIAL
ncbi:PorV/PorQ family protein [Haliscomenobacter hydrossis]|uniref:DUF3308 domain-containing protein n=1 Tax=Haliscomenobacter hydrossis (strain ATCC 27775 / DSM 1100 / LMG 10767 / O) TaxID=760192 RepID=F4L5P8_HALH1|nr:PorV/PorQ family protein [Haliscomenobacter hydrossis]AEE51883.1 hypothetical protein Halhy_4035 [Haliscomenobacter hydrossis DSM 1100]